MDKLFDLTGKIVVVTGGNNGKLGPLWVDTLEKAGALVTIIDLPNYDVTDIGSLSEFASYMRVNKTIPDIIINNAAIDNPPSAEGTNFFSAYEKIINVNLLGALRVFAVFKDEMVRKGGGTIINIGSIMGNIGADWRNYPDNFEKPVAYNLSKAALIQMSRSITTQYGRYGIRSATISFGPYSPADNPLPESFTGKFLKNVPLGRCISEQSMRTTLLYACCCPELAGTQCLVDGGYTAW